MLDINGKNLLWMGRWPAESKRLIIKMTVIRTHERTGLNRSNVVYK